MTTTTHGKPEYFGTGEAAKKLGVNRTTVLRLAHAHEIGLFAAGRYLFSEADLAKFKPHLKKRGCPKFVPGNDLWKTRKNIQKFSP